MKRGLIVSILLILISLGFVVAQEEVFEVLPGGDKLAKIASGEEDPTEKIENIKDGLIPKEGQNYGYLLDEWGDTIQNNKYIGPVISFIDAFFSFFNPLWSFLFGIEFSFSTVFLLSIIAFVFLFILFHYPIRYFDFSILVSSLVALLLSGLVGYLNGIESLVSYVVSTVTNGWILFILSIISFMFVFLYVNLFSSLIKKKEIDDEEFRKTKFKHDAEIAGKLTKTISKNI